MQKGDTSWMTGCSRPEVGYIVMVLLGKSHNDLLHRRTNQLFSVPVGYE